ncbi:MAG: hypothetical protein L0H24_13200, partial [Microlunatus sp.]|nr:hypothetical protein [Microlunatus sp.]
VDRAFAELVAGFDRTAERREPPGGDREVADPAPEPGSVFETPPSTPALEWLPDPEPDAAEQRYDPGPPAALPRPTWPVLIGWLGLGYAVLAVLAMAVGIRLPTWAAWAAGIGFVGGFGLLVSRLPRHRPPDAGDGAVL